MVGCRLEEISFQYGNLLFTSFVATKQSRQNIINKPTMSSAYIEISGEFGLDGVLTPSEISTLRGKYNSVLYLRTDNGTDTR